MKKKKLALINKNYIREFKNFFKYDSFYNLVPLLSITFIILIQLRMISPFRLKAIDEASLIDISYSIINSNFFIPKNEIMSHLNFGLDKIWLWSPPGYVYLLAGFQYLFGFTPESTGVFHLIFRLFSCLIFFLILRKLNISKNFSSFLTCYWALLCQGEDGRFEDPAILFFLLSIFLILNTDINKINFIFSGLFLGFGVFTTPRLIYLGPSIIISILFYKYDKKIIKKSFLIFSSMSVIISTWLFWVLPYWDEFRVQFLEFALLDSATELSIFDSLKSLMMMIMHPVARDVPWWYFKSLHLHYSSIPLILFFISLLIFSLKRNDNKIKLFSGLALTAIIIFIVFSVKNRMHHSTLVWLNIGMMTLLPFLIRTSSFKLRHLNSSKKYFIYFLFSVMILQMLLHSLLQIMIILGDISVAINCGKKPHNQIFNNIKPGEKIIAKDPEIFYQMIGTNPIYWTAGLDGQTAGNVQYKANYDSTYIWLAEIRDPFDKNTKNPGAKFRWDSKSYKYFKDNFDLFQVSNIDSCCSKGIAKASRVRRNIYLFKRN